MSDQFNEAHLLDALLDSWARSNTILLNLLHALPEGGLEARATGLPNGQIKLALKLAGHPIPDDQAGPLTWGVWTRKAAGANVAEHRNRPHDP